LISVKQSIYRLMFAKLFANKKATYILIFVSG
jgi:hypothetical protein